MQLKRTEEIIIQGTYTLKLYLTGDLEFLRETTMPVLPDDTESVIDSRGSCVSHSLDSIVLDHRSFMEAGGDLKRTKRVLFSSGLMYSHKDLTNRFWNMRKYSLGGGGGRGVLSTYLGSRPCSKDENHIAR